uniref:AlNc14C106G6240 protein n=1 Tax=Albugo laibachii Nc14 TaxID=890382 RepID=F0WI33_9STRA|nr:AlNc14C106G6240 [Albugo laibachii Nc14]|eukprot:CCA20911.1 AlNc14C106G6240 [Albugo laibachii Nc14]
MTKSMLSYPALLLLCSVALHTQGKGNGYAMTGMMHHKVKQLSSDVKYQNSDALASQRFRRELMKKKKAKVPTQRAPEVPSCVTFEEEFDNKNPEFNQEVIKNYLNAFRTLHAKFKGTSNIDKPLMMKLAVMTVFDLGWLAVLLSFFSPPQPTLIYNDCGLTVNIGNQHVELQMPNKTKLKFSYTQSRDFSSNVLLAGLEEKLSKLSQRGKEHVHADPGSTSHGSCDVK